MGVVLRGMSDDELVRLEEHWAAKAAEHRSWGDDVGSWRCAKQLAAVADERRARHPVPPGWPAALPLVDERHIPVGLVVWSRSGDLEGRTTGSRLPCRSSSCDGWQIGVRWETGQQLFLCSTGWTYDTGDGTIRVTGGGEISARTATAHHPGAEPLPRHRWPDREALERTKGWRQPA